MNGRKIKTVPPALHLEVSCISVLMEEIQEKSIYRILELWATIESDGLIMSDRILFQNWFNRAHYAKLSISIINRLSNRRGAPIIDVEIPGRFPSLVLSS